MAGALTGAAAATPLVPTPGEAALGWTVSVVAGALWVAGFVSLGRSPLDARARLPWVGLMLLLPVLGALIWFWWRHRYYPARGHHDGGAVVGVPRRRYGAPEE